MKLRNLFSITITFITSSITAMNEPSLEQYKNVLATGNCGEIVQTTKQLWYSNTDGIHLHWTGRELQVAGGPKKLSNGTFLKDALYRDALHDWFVKQLLHPAMYGTANIRQVFAKIDELSNNCDGIFGDDRGALTQTAVKCAIVAARFGDDPGEHLSQAFILGLPEIYNRRTISDLINYVGAQTGELSFLGGKLPFNVKLYHNRRLIGLIGIAAVVCVGCSVGYKKYYATDDKDNADEEDE